jgi:hypothetical protein
MLLAWHGSSVSCHRNLYEFFTRLDGKRKLRTASVLKLYKLLGELGRQKQFELSFGKFEVHVCDKDTAVVARRSLFFAYVMVSTRLKSHSFGWLGLLLAAYTLSALGQLIDWLEIRVPENYSLRWYSPTRAARNTKTQPKQRLGSLAEGKSRPGTDQTICWGIFRIV